MSKLDTAEERIRKKKVDQRKLECSTETYKDIRAYKRLIGQNTKVQHTTNSYSGIKEQEEGWRGNI